MRAAAEVDEERTALAEVRTVEISRGAGVHNLRADRADLDAVRGWLRQHAFGVVFDSAYDWERGAPRI